MLIRRQLSVGKAVIFMAPWDGNICFVCRRNRGMVMRRHTCCMKPARWPNTGEGRCLCEVISFLPRSSKHKRKDSRNAADV
jgi:hypothetical protein